MPEGYRGVVVRECGEGEMLGTGGQGREERRGVNGVLREAQEEEEEEEKEEEEAIQVLEEVAKFEEVVVWGHELVPDRDDVFVKGMAEWIRFAEAVSYSIPEIPEASEEGWVEDADMMLS